LVRHHHQARVLEGAMQTGHQLLFFGTVHVCLRCCDADLRRPERSAVARGRGTQGCPRIPCPVRLSQKPERTPETRRRLALCLMPAGGLSRGRLRRLQSRTGWSRSRIAPVPLPSSAAPTLRVRDGRTRNPSYVPCVGPDRPVRSSLIPGPIVELRLAFL